LSRSAAAIQTALAQLNANQGEQAKVTLRRALQRDAADPMANKLMGMVLSGENQQEQALYHFKRAIAGAPSDIQLRFMLGNLYLIMRKDKEGIEAFSQAIRVDPTYLMAYDGLAKCLLRMGDHDAAVAAYEAGIAAAPDDPTAYCSMGSALSVMGRVPDAIAALKRGIARLPDKAVLREALCYHTNFADNVTPQEALEAHAALGRIVEAQGRARFPQAHTLTNTKDPERPLRVGFISGEFCWHACAMFMEGLIQGLNRSRIQPYCYYVRSEIEAPTERFAAMVGPNQWRHVAAANDQQIAQLIVNDKIDILIDTMGWTEHQKMHVFEPRVAPIQATWLGYPNTTGLPSMDYRIVDAITDPPGAEAFVTEKLIRLPGCFLTFLPAPHSPDPALTPALAESQSAISQSRRGDHNPQSAITFGSFNRLSKVRPAVARTWAAILRAVPSSRLLIKSSLVSQDTKAHYMREFAAEGVAPERLIWSSFVPGVQAHLAMYHQVDIALDSFPYNGTTTTCEATWMGVPVITLTGEVGVHRARVGTSLLTALNLPELIAPTREKYIELAAQLANDRPRILEYHRTLRSRMAASPLCDSKTYAQNFEAALRQVWRQWCAKP
jgi:predicted O-linked N-acetylglucosamine transferase (SPINDLY family)